MIKNILKYALFGLIVSFIFAVFTISVVKHREDVINNFPTYWQVLWLIILNCTGVLAHFAARFVTRITLKNKLLEKTTFLMFFLVCVAFAMVFFGYRSKSGVWIPMHKTAAITQIMWIDIGVFFVFMIFAYSVIYLILEYKYVLAEQQKNEK